MSKLPNPSSIAKKFGLGKLETLIKPTRIANELINFSIPDVSSNGHFLSSPYDICVLIFLPSTSNSNVKSTICDRIVFTSSCIYGKIFETNSYGTPFLCIAFR